MAAFLISVPPACWALSAQLSTSSLLFAESENITSLNQSARFFLVQRSKKLQDL